MARPHVADGGDGLQIWRIAANILNIQYRTADKGWPSNLVVGRGANNTLQKNELVTEIHKKPRIWTDSLDNIPKRNRETRNAYTILVRMPEGKRPLGRSRSTWGQY
jgi:hypothetical protein